MLLTDDEISRLTPDECLVLIARLWDSLADHQVHLTRAQQAELERRLATLDHDAPKALLGKRLRQNSHSVARSVARSFHRSRAHGTHRRR
jgi:putative addiction module component (TIGR02574 family)